MNTEYWISFSLIQYKALQSIHVEESAACLILRKYFLNLHSNLLLEVINICQDRPGLSLVIHR